MDKQTEKKSPEQNSENKRENNWLVFSMIAGLVLFVAGIAAFLYVGREKFSGGSIPWIFIAVAVLIVLVGVAAIVIARKKEKHQPDYYTFFIMGITWLAIGLPLKNPGLWVMGIIFLVIGLVNRDKWKDRRTWSGLTPVERNMKLAAIIILGVLALAGLAAWYLSVR